MTPAFDHEKLRVYHETLRFVAWVGSIIEQLPAKVAARDQLDRASTSILLNLAEGNGKRSQIDRCRFLDISRGSALESAACLDVLVARKLLAAETVLPGKTMLHGIDLMLAGLIGHFAPTVREEQARYGVENEND